MGKWIHLDTSFKSYINPESIHCVACGKMIPKNVWVSEKDDKGLPFCNADCEKMYDYILQRQQKKSKAHLRK
jgi:hypothetical protein